MRHERPVLCARYSPPSGSYSQEFVCVMMTTLGRHSLLQINRLSKDDTNQQGHRQASQKGEDQDGRYRLWRMWLTCWQASKLCFHHSLEKASRTMTEYIIMNTATATHCAALVWKVRRRIRMHKRDWRRIALHHRGGGRGLCRGICRGDWRSHKPRSSRWWHDQDNHCGAA